MNSHSERRGRIAGIDYGTVRLGIAITDVARKMASPYENYTRCDADRDAVRLRQLVEEEQVTMFVVGLPVHVSGNESQKSFEARQFGAWIQEQTGCDVVFFDERYSSKLAEELLKDADLTSKQRKKRRDMLAAQILLQGYLESGGDGVEDPGPLDD